MDDRALRYQLNITDGYLTQASEIRTCRPHCVARELAGKVRVKVINTKLRAASSQTPSQQMACDCKG
jgi:hypothetical protein